MPDKKSWTADDMPDLSGKTIIVTGGNSGIGYEAALQFARKQAHVILACRGLGKARAAAAQIAASAPGAKVEVMELDLANLASVRSFADAFHLQHQALHVLVNNAGVMAIPYRQTADGFEMQFGTNHLGHFALTGLLLDRLLATEGARVVNVASGAHRIGSHSLRRSPVEERLPQVARLRAEQARQPAVHLRVAAPSSMRPATKLLCVACHPGYAATNLQAAGPKMPGSSVMESSFRGGKQAARAERRDGRVADRVCGRRAQTSTAATTSALTGWASCGDIRSRVGRSAAAQDAAAAARLWEVSEQLTNVHYQL